MFYMGHGGLIELIKCDERKKARSAGHPLSQSHRYELNLLETTLQLQT